MKNSDGRVLKSPITFNPKNTETDDITRYSNVAEFVFDAPIDHTSGWRPGPGRMLAFEPNKYDKENVTANVQQEALKARLDLSRSSSVSTESRLRMAKLARGIGQPGSNTWSGIRVHDAKELAPPVISKREENLMLDMNGMREDLTARTSELEKARATITSIRIEKARLESELREVQTLNIENSSEKKKTAADHAAELTLNGKERKRLEAELSASHVEVSSLNARLENLSVLAEEEGSKWRAELLSAKRVREAMECEIRQVREAVEVHSQLKTVTELASANGDAICSMQLCLNENKLDVKSQESRIQVAIELAIENNRTTILQAIKHEFSSQMGAYIETLSSNIKNEIRELLPAAIANSTSQNLVRAELADKLRAIGGSLKTCDHILPHPLYQETMQ